MGLLQMHGLELLRCHTALDLLREKQTFHGEDLAAFSGILLKNKKIEEEGRKIASCTQKSHSQFILVNLKTPFSLNPKDSGH